MTDAPCGKMGPATIIINPRRIDAGQPRIDRLLFLSTGHLTWATLERIEAASSSSTTDVCGMSAVAYGLFGYVRDEREDADDVPDDLWACFEYARALGVSYIRFDCDESLIAALPDHSSTHP